MLGRLPLVTDHITENWVLIYDYMANRKRGKEGAFDDHLPRTPIRPYASQRSLQSYDG